MGWKDQVYTVSLVFSSTQQELMVSLLQIVQLHANGSFSVPSLLCESTVSTGARIFARWRFIHTGGLPLTATSLLFVRQDAEGRNSTLTGPHINATTVTAGSALLLTNFTYIPVLSAANSDGRVTVECPAILLTVGNKVVSLYSFFLAFVSCLGIPQRPEFLGVELLEGSTAQGRRARVTVHSAAPGVEPGGLFTFMLTQVLLDPITTFESVQRITEYISGTNITFHIDNLTIGENYRFDLAVSNRFGVSENVSTPIIFILPGKPAQRICLIH